jgi:hypothetical protein
MFGYPAIESLLKPKNANLGSYTIVQHVGLNVELRFKCQSFIVCYETHNITFPTHKFFCSYKLIRKNRSIYNTYQHYYPNNPTPIPLPWKTRTPRPLT